VASLNQISETIAYKMGDPFNTMLRENVKFTFKYWRAMLIRRDVAANGLSDEYLQRFSFDLIKVDRIDDCNFTFGCENILRSKVKIPKPVRFKTDVVFKFMGAIDLQGNFKPASYVEFEEFRYTKFNRFTSKVLRYNYTNGYIYFFNNTFLKKAIAQSAFSDPTLVNSFCDEECYNDDMEFPCPDDMIQQIVQGIFNGEFPLKTKPLAEEVNIEKEE
jgi:hypothetical protein